MTDQLTDEQTEAAYKQLVVKFPRIEKLAVDPPVAGQNTALYSFKLLPKPVNGVYGFLKFRGAFASEPEWESHAKNIIRNVDSKHHIYPYQQGRWAPITVNEDFIKEFLDVKEQEEIADIYNQRDTQEQQRQKQAVKEIKSKERKLQQEMFRKEPDQSSLDYYAQQVMKVQQLESWLEQMRQRKHDMLKALKAGRGEIKRLEESSPEYKDKVDERIRCIKEEIGLDEDTPIDRPSIVQQAGGKEE